MADHITDACSTKLVLLTGHSNAVTDAAFSPDGSTLATCSYDGSVITWDASTGEIRHKLFSDGDPLSSVSFSPDGCSVASAGADGARIWDTETGSLQYVVPDSCQPIAYLPSGQLLSVDCSDHPDRLAVWETTGAVVRRLAAGEGYIGDLSVSADGTIAATADCAEIALWNLMSGHLVGSLHVPSHVISSERVRAIDIEAIALSPDSTMLAAVCCDAVRIWDLKTSAYSKTLRTRAMAAVFSPDGESLALGLADGSVLICETGNWRCVRRISKARRGWVRRLTYSPDGRLLVSAGDDHATCIWHAQTGRLIRVLEGQGTPVTSVAFTDEDHLIARHSNGAVRQWSLDSGPAVGLPQAEDTSSRSVRIPPRIAEQVRCLEPIDEPITAVYSPNGDIIAVGHMGFLATLWDVRTGRLLRKLHTSRDLVSALAFSPDGQTIAAATSYDNMVELFSVRTGRKKRTLFGHTSRVNSICFSPDGRRVATASDDGSIVIWNPRSGRLMATLLALTKGSDGTELEWIIHTPCGGFNASPGAVRYIRRMVDGRAHPITPSP